jgi:hypothetical protein
MSADSVWRWRPRGRGASRGVVFLYCLVASALSPVAGGALLAQTQKTKAGFSQAAADRCAVKITRLEEYAGAKIPAGQIGKKSTQLTEDELNSYLELVLRPQYHPSLKSLQVRFVEARLQGSASIDFDRVELKDTSLLSGLLRKMLTGVHSLEMLSGFASGGGKGNLQLEEARFDGLMLPNLLVAEIITAVCRKQDPPFDPMKPSVLPYSIQKVDLHAGYIVVYQ